MADICTKDFVRAHGKLPTGRRNWWFEVHQRTRSGKTFRMPPISPPGETTFPAAKAWATRMAFGSDVVRVVVRP